MPSERRSLCLLLLATALLWAGSTWRCGFSLDDREVLFGNPVVEGELPWRAVFDRDYWQHQGPAGHWRPLATSSLRIERALFGEWARGYHLSNAAAHMAVLALAWLCARRLWPRELRGARRGRDPLWLGLCVLAWHPALADSVAWISGRTSSLSALAGLAGAFWLLRLAPHHEPARATNSCLPEADAPTRRASELWLLPASFAGLALALMAKEDGLIFAPLYVAIGLSRSRRGAWLAGAGSALALAAWLGARAWALGGWLPAAPYAPLELVPLSERATVGLRSLAQLLRLAFWPAPHSPARSVEALRAPAGLDAQALLALVLAALGALWAANRLWRRARGAAQPIDDGPPPPAAPPAPAAPGSSAVLPLSMALVLAAWLPHAQWIPSGELFAPRFLYLPLLFGLPLVGSLLARAPRPLVWLALGALWSLSWQQAAVYQSKSSYWERVARFEPEDARAQDALGNARMQAGELERARRHFERALELRPRYARAWVNLGNLHMAAGRDLEAEACLRRAVELQPRSAKAWGNLGVLYLRAELFEPARAAYREALDDSPGMAALWRGLARAEHGLGAREREREALARALALDPGDSWCRAALAELEASPEPR